MTSNPSEDEFTGLCCCDAANVVQPCGPCRCEDHDQCADPKL